MSRRPQYKSVLHDSARWDDFEFRPGDIVISTPPKCGTTWMQKICSLLIFQNPRIETPLAITSPWLDMLTKPKAEVFAQLAAQQHRRFIKTHTPLDGIPFNDRVTYICVGRDPRDVAISMFNHMANIDFEVFMEALHRVAVMEGADRPNVPPPPPPSLPPTAELFFWHWLDDPTPATDIPSSLLSTLHHFEAALSARLRPNVVVMHYGDLKTDLEAEMRHLAERLHIEVPQQDWHELIAAASFESMRARADVTAPNADQKIWKDTRQFFHSGTGGHWREFFDDTAQQRYEARVAVLASPEVAIWAHSG